MVLGSLLALFAVQTADAGWSMHAHTNYLKESIRILPILDYEMCLHYRGALLAGIVEGEVHFKFRAEGHSSPWLGALSKEQVGFLNGLPVNESTIDQASILFAGRFAGLRSEIAGMKRPYQETLFELGFYLAAINNVLLPQYESSHFPEQRLASDTASWPLDSKQVETIQDIDTWMETMLAKKIKLRDRWSEAAAMGDLERFKELAREANTMNVAVLASLISFVLDRCYGPADPEHRAKVGKHHEQHLEIVNGRKPWFYGRDRGDWSENEGVICAVAEPELYCQHSTQRWRRFTAAPLEIRRTIRHLKATICPERPTHCHRESPSVC